MTCEWLNKEYHQLVFLARNLESDVVQLRKSIDMFRYTKAGESVRMTDDIIPLLEKYDETKDTTDPIVQQIISFRRQHSKGITQLVNPDIGLTIFYIMVLIYIEELEKKLKHGLEAVKAMKDQIDGKRTEIKETLLKLLAVQRELYSI
jgi:hypothetical protein